MPKVSVASVDKDLAALADRLRVGYSGGERREAEMETADRLLDIRLVLVARENARAAA